MNWIDRTMSWGIPAVVLLSGWFFPVETLERLELMGNGSASIGLGVLALFQQVFWLRTEIHKLKTTTGGVGR